MKQSQNDLDKLFKDKLGNAEITPPNKLWSQIEQQLPSRKPYFFENKGIIITTVALLCGLLSIFTIQKIKSNRIAPLTDGEINRIEQPLISAKENMQKTKVNKPSSQFYSYKAPNKVSIQIYESKKESISINDILVLEQTQKESKMESIATVVQDNSISNEENLADYINIPTTTVIETELADAQLDIKAISLDDANNNVDALLTTEEIIPKDASLHHPTENNNSERLSSKKRLEVAFEENDIRTTTSNKMWKKNEISPEYIAGIDEVDPKTLKAIRNKMQFEGNVYQKGFYFGPYIGVNNTWLLVSKKFPDKHYRVENVDYKWSFAKSYGLALGYDFNKHFGILSEMGLGSEVNQTYIEKPTEGNLVERQVKLNYLDFPVYFKYKMQFGSRYDHKPIVFSVLAGPRFGTLKSSKSYQNGVEQPINQRINKAEWGLAGGLETDFYLNKYCFFTVGLRGSFGSNLANFPKLQGNDHKDPISYRFGMFTRFNFRIPTGKH